MPLERTMLTFFQATMDNWKTARKAMKEAQAQVDLKDKDHGSAYQEFEKQKQSIEFQLASLKNTWMSFLNNISGGREGISKFFKVLMASDLSQINLLQISYSRKLLDGVQSLLV